MRKRCSIFQWLDQRPRVIKCESMLNGSENECGNAVQSSQYLDQRSRVVKCESRVNI